jgi:small-conductance mechanosensitive channel
VIPELLRNNPEVLAVLIAVAGFLVANILARFTERLLMRLDGYLQRRSPDRLEQVDMRMLRQALRGLVYYGSLVFFLLLALQTLSITVVREWLDLLLQYVPQLILSGLIMLSGYFIGVVLRGLVAGLMGVSADHLAPRLTQVMVVTSAVLTGLAQISIDISFISNVLVILLAFFFGGLSLAFALGSRQLVQNLLARRALDRYRIGDHVRLNDVQGRIVEILGTAVVLEAEEGIVTVPTSRFVESEVLLLREEEPGEDNVGSA